jgi:hypothetical protein
LSFVETHCIDCHNDSESNGDFNIDALGLELTDEAVRQKWTRVFDMATSGEMPPDPDYNPSQADLSAFEKDLAGVLINADHQHGRVRDRRLNNREIEYAIRDVLGVDMAIGRFLPPNTKLHGMDNQAAALSPTADFLLNYSRYADRVIDRLLNPPSSVVVTSHTTTDEERRSARFELDKTMLRRGHSVFVYGSSHRSRLTFPRVKARYDGRYRFSCNLIPANLNIDVEILIKGAGSKMGRGNVLQTFAHRQVQGRGSAQAQPHLVILNHAHGKQNVAIETDLTQGEFFALHTETRMSEVTEKTIDSVDSFEAIPGFYVQNVRIEGPLPRKVSESVSLFDEKRAVDLLQAKAYLRHVLPKLFRRPLETDELREFTLMLTRGEIARDGLESALKKALMSPSFLYNLSYTKHDAHIATRLSLLLWKSLPDEVLLQAAREGKLKSGLERRRQAERMLNNSRAKRFAGDFLDQWLWLDRFYRLSFPTRANTAFHKQPELALYGMLAQPHLMFGRLLAENRSLLELVDSDWSYLNENLAGLYGVQGTRPKPGKQMTLVNLPKGSDRGGILNQGGLMRITSVVDDTSPVVRGVWMADNILSLHIPEPPNNVPDFIPDTRAAKTLKQQFLLHRKLEACASCHEKIDPIGFAFESYGTAGEFRTHYTVPKTGRSSKAPTGSVIDTSGFTFRGETIRSVQDVKSYILKHPEETFVKCFLEKLVAYTLGRPAQFADRAAIEALMRDARKTNYATRDLILDFVASELFYQSHPKTDGATP